MLVDFLKEKGFSYEDILAPTRIDSSLLEDIDNQLNCLQFVQLIKQAMVLTDNQALGLEFGQRYNFTGGGLLSLGAMAAPTFEESIQFATQTAKVLNPLLSTELVHTETTLEIELIEKLPWGDTKAFIVETMFSIITMGVKQLSPHSLKEIIFEFNYTPNNTELYQQYFLPAQLRFGAEHNRLTMPLSLARKKQLTFNPTTMRQAQKLLDEKITTIQDKKTAVVTPIKMFILANEGRIPSIDEAAAKLNISASTLKRRLKSVDTSYSTVVSDVRKSLAREYLLHSTDSIDQIAFRLGYQTASNFSTSFKGWYKLTPSQFRTEGQKQKT
ncbi:AraC family transcriptional regulator [Zhongshania aliphaticivorans]|uniref:AraC family transcriptional regulator n=1 Tax=Zhongshania aliphaticivorans TaxID=1470434 RepID=UPI0013306D2F|nr:AraC family transcriptional regulator [Zhongshania aliphaticivorans]